jgi:hypothetical protein
MTPLPHNGVMFVHDFIRALNEVERLRHSRPHFDEPRWFRCLAEADQHDHARAWKAKCDARDAQSHHSSHVRYYQNLSGDAIARFRLDRSLRKF